MKLISANERLERILNCAAMYVNPDSSFSVPPTEVIRHELKRTQAEALEAALRIIECKGSVLGRLFNKSLIKEIEQLKSESKK